MAMVAFAAIAVTACQPENGGGASNDDSNMKEQPSALYSERLGDWVYTGDNNKSNNVTLSQKVANRELYMSGLMGLPFDIVGEYSSDRNDIIFSSQIAEEEYDFGDGLVGEIHLIGIDRDGVFYGLNENGNYGIAIAGVMDGGYRAVVRYGVNTPGYPKFVAMMFAAYIDGEYYSVKGDIPAFNGFAGLEPATAKTKSSAPMAFALGKSLLPTATPQLRIGKKIECVQF
jgi:hypothetical protein